VGSGRTLSRLWFCAQKGRNARRGHMTLLKVGMEAYPTHFRGLFRGVARGYGTELQPACEPACQSTMKLARISLCELVVPNIQCAAVADRWGAVLWSEDPVGPPGVHTKT
jgi:hypothetical protein